MKDDIHKKNTPMSPDVFANRMLVIRQELGSRDEEWCHSKMDNLLCELLIELGYEEGIKIYQAQEKWYA